MTEQLQLLVELQEIDSAIFKKNTLILAIPRKAQSAEKTLHDTRLSSEKQRQKYEELEKKKRDRERLFEETQERIRKLKARVSEIKNNREYQAHLKEIEAVERERHAIEDEILALMESLDAAQKDLRARESEVKAEGEKVDAFKRRLDAEIAAAEKELDALRLRRGRMVERIEPAAYELYFRLLESAQGLAVVEARDEVCRGCNMNIPPQLFVELKKSERLIQCPQCGRILFWKKEETSG